ncbi:hypothetical protein AVJ23_00730 [Pseudoponticoccus marisrubri]|uniref:Uncharacterized protein n=1 Tax=Pseudoponticoccus marisrubri TaxID=1685382 RepID=A0A0W7WP52_9RHOB|nr:hypothetical protein AVJ23_00730 [Pseudoponticoccus marisrubri]
MEDDGAGMPVQAKLLLDHFDGRFEVLDIDPLICRRVQTEREKMLLAARAFGHGLRFEQGVQELLIGYKSSQLVQLDMLIVPLVHKMAGELGSVPAL